jgi:hypothetical protein
LTPEFTEASIGPENLIIVLVLGLGLAALGGNHRLETVGA